MPEYMLHITGSIRVEFDDKETIPVTATELWELYVDCLVNPYDLDTLNLRLEPCDVNESPAPEAPSLPATGKVDQLTADIREIFGLSSRTGDIDRQQLLKAMTRLKEEGPIRPVD